MLWYINSSTPVAGQTFIDSHFQELWWRHVGLHMPTLWRQDEWVIIKKPVLSRLFTFKQLRILGWTTDWSRILAPEYVQKLVELSQQHDFPWDYFKVVWSEEKNRHEDFLPLRNAGMQVIHIPVYKEYSVNLEAGWEGYLKTRSSNGRKDIQRRLRKAQHLNPTLITYRTDSERLDFVRTFCEQHRHYWIGKTGYSVFENPAEEAFLTAWLDHLSATGALRLHGVLLGDQIANLIISASIGGQWYSFMSINTGICTEYAPGILGLYLELQRAADEGAKWFHLGPGDHDYKQRGSTHAFQCYQTLVAHPRSLRGQALLWVKDALHRTYRI